MRHSEIPNLSGEFILINPANALTLAIILLYANTIRENVLANHLV